MATKTLEGLIEEFNRLPGIGKKSATRLAFHILEMEDKDIKRFAETMLKVKENTKRCKICDNLSEDEICSICDDGNRDKGVICVVEDSKDITTFEKIGTYNGVYHVLNGKIAPLDGVTPDKLNLKTLITRVGEGDIKEIILGLNPDLEGETTSMYLMKLLKVFDIKVTKIASGIPIGGNIEFTDIPTISKALEGRQEVD